MGRGQERAGIRLCFDSSLGCSPQCRAAVSSAFEEVQRRLRAGGTARARLHTELGACGHLDGVEDQAELLEALQALVGGAVQYDGQAGAPLSVRQLCGLLVPDPGNCSRSAPYGGLRRAAKVSAPEHSGTSPLRPPIPDTPAAVRSRASGSRSLPRLRSPELSNGNGSIAPSSNLQGLRQAPTMRVPEFCLLN